MGIEITETEQLMLSKTLPVSGEYITCHRGAQGNVALWASGGELSDALRNPLRNMQSRQKPHSHLCFSLEVINF